MQSPDTLFLSPRFLHAALLLVAVVFFHDSASTVNADDHAKHYLQQDEDQLRTYIIHVEQPPASHAVTHRNWHESFLDHTGSAPRLVHSYSHVLSGFAARLTGAEVQALRGIPGFVDAQPTRRLELHTTHTPSFLVLRQGAAGAWAKEFNYGRGVIIGVLDTGISLSHPSFLDDGSIPPPLPKWKGKCEFSDASLCNNKLIGARSFLNSSSTSKPSFQQYDDNGHGIHTAGTAAGAFVARASILNNAKGTAVGMAPWAHVAAYQVCNETCYDSDVVAGILAAVADGVDIISMSLGGTEFVLCNDSIGIASFAAARKGVLVSASAGNSVPDYFSAENTYPWALTVGAGTTDRRIRAVVRLANGTEFQGESAYQHADFNSNSFLPLVLPSSARTIQPSST